MALRPSFATFSGHRSLRPTGTRQHFSKPDGGFALFMVIHALGGVFPIGTARCAMGGALVFGSRRLSLLGLLVLGAQPVLLGLDQQFPCRYLLRRDRA
jgi:hypothetical protein